MNVSSPQGALVQLVVDNLREVGLTGVRALDGRSLDHIDAADRRRAA